MEKRLSLPHSSPTGSHSMPELAGSIHCRQLSPAQPSHVPMSVHHSHSFDQSPRLTQDTEPEFAACRGQYTDPTMHHSGQSSAAYGRHQENLSYDLAVQHHHYGSQGYDEQLGATHVLPSPPVQQPLQPHWPSTQTLTYPQPSSYSRPASTTVTPHVTPNIPRHVTDPRLLRNRRPSVDILQSTSATSWSGLQVSTNLPVVTPVSAVSTNAAVVGTIQNQNLAERLSVGPSPTPGTSSQHHLMSMGPRSTGPPTGLTCGTASTAQPPPTQPPTERRTTGDDNHVDTALRTAPADGGAAGTRSDVVAAVGSSTNVKAANVDAVPTSGDIVVPPGGRQSGNYNASLMDAEDMSDDLVDQIVRGRVMGARLKPAAMPSIDSFPTSVSLESHPTVTVAPVTPVMDSVTSEQLSKTSHEILEEMAKIKMLQEVKAAAEKLSQNAAVAAAATVASTTTISSVPFPLFVPATAAVPTVPSVVAAHSATDTATVTQPPRKSESSTHQPHHAKKQTVVARKQPVGKKEKTKEKEMPCKRDKNTSVIRTANDMKMFLNANKVHNKRDCRVTKRIVTQKRVDPRLVRG